MSFEKIVGKWDLRFLLKALAAWAVAALLLLLAASLIVSKSSLGAGALGYVSSGISFLAAAFAGALAKRGGKGGLSGTLIAAALLCLVLLTVGYLIGGSRLEPSGILSVVTFSFAGCLTGSVFFGGGKERRKKTKFRPKPRC